MGKDNGKNGFRRRKYRSELWKLCKSLLVGVGNSAIDWGLFFLLTVPFSVAAWIAQPIGYIVAAINSYAVNRKVTFGTTRRFFSAELLRFSLLTALTAAASSLLMGFVTHGLGLSGTFWKDLAAKVGVTAFTSLLNFSLSRLWVFRSAEE